MTWGRKAAAQGLGLLGKLTCGSARVWNYASPASCSRNLDFPIAACFRGAGALPWRGLRSAPRRGGVCGAGRKPAARDSWPGCAPAGRGHLAYGCRWALAGMGRCLLGIRLKALRRPRAAGQGLVLQYYLRVLRLQKTPVLCYVRLRREAAPGSSCAALRMERRPTFKFKFCAVALLWMAATSSLPAFQGFCLLPAVAG